MNIYEIFLRILFNIESGTMFIYWGGEKEQGEELEQGHGQRQGQEQGQTNC